MILQSKSFGTWGIFEVQGSIESSDTKIFINTLSNYIKNSEKNDYIIDLTQSPFLSIAAIRFMNQLSKDLENKSSRFLLMGANDRIKRNIETFVSWKNIREITSLWEAIPFYLEKYGEIETPIEILVGGDALTHEQGLPETN